MGSDGTQVDLVLTFMNNLGSNIASAKLTAKIMSAELGKTASQTPKTADNLKNMKKSGLEDIRAGKSLLDQLKKAVNQAALFEEAMLGVENAMYDSSLPLEEQKKQLEELRELALSLGAETKFGYEDAAKAQEKLLQNGMAFQDVLEGGAKASLYLGQTAGIAPTAAAEAVNEIAKKFSLNGSQLMEVADDITRAADAGNVGVQVMMDNMTQAGGTAQSLGLTAKETSLMLGTLHGMGLGDSSGSYLKDMLSGLNRATPEARKALEAMGMLNGATVTETSSGAMKISGGENSMFNEQGQIKSAQHLIESLRASLQGVDLSSLYDAGGKLLPAAEIEALVEQSSNLAGLQNFKDAFGLEGMRAAIALTQTGKDSYAEMAEKASHMKGIEEQVISQQDTLLAKLATLKESWNTLMTSSGTPLVEELKSFADTANNALQEIQAWTEAHPEATKAIMKTIGGLALLKMGSGVFKYLGGTVGGFIFSLGQAASKVKNFASTFGLFRRVAGLLGMLWSAVTSGFSILLKAGGFLVDFGIKALAAGGRALLAGARMALAWLIGLGPVGWIIIGVTALIAGGIAAWKTNFLGFRDWILDKVAWIADLINKVKGVFNINSSNTNLTVVSNKGQDLNNSPDLKFLNDPASIPFLGDGGSSADNRQYTFNINSTDPEGAANEINSLFGGKDLDKYQASRDPRFADYLYPAYPQLSWG